LPHVTLPHYQTTIQSALLQPTCNMIGFWIGCAQAWHIIE
jgi:hypothetical protein